MICLQIEYSVTKRYNNGGYFQGIAQKIMVPGFTTVNSVAIRNY